MEEFRNQRINHNAVDQKATSASLGGGGTALLLPLDPPLVKDQTVSYLLTNGLLSKEQHAFIAKHSTVTNLLKCVHDWAFPLHNRMPQNIIYFDFLYALIVLFIANCVLNCKDLDLTDCYYYCLMLGAIISIV